MKDVVGERGMWLTRMDLGRRDEGTYKSLLMIHNSHLQFSWKGNRAGPLGPLG